MSPDQNWDRSAGNVIDRLVSLDLREREHASSPNLIRDLYESALKEAEEPLTYGAARALREELEPRDTVLIVTGAGVPPWLPYRETDGPPGAVGLAHGLAVALGARPVIAIEERSREPLVAATHAMGLVDVPYDILQNRNTAVSIASYPEGKDGSEAAATELLATYDPQAVIAVEKMGPNSEGAIMEGEDLTEGHAWVAPLFDIANERDILTVGIGDRGNEIGFGRIEDEVDAAYAASEGFTGTACRVPTDHLVVSGTSNWGAYGIEAMLALLTETPEAMHMAEQEIRVLEHHTIAGSADAITHKSKNYVDGTAEEVQRGIVGILHNIVENRLSVYDKIERREQGQEE